MAPEAVDPELKDKYYDALHRIEQLERKEQQWHRADELLRQCISRLTVVADDRDPAISGQLQRLRRLVRDAVDPERLERLIADLSEAIRLQPIAAEPHDPRAILAEVIGGLNLPDAIAAPSARLCDRLADGTVELAPALEEFGSLLAAGLEPAERERGLFGRLLRGRGEAAREDDDPALHFARTLLERTLAGWLQQHADDATATLARLQAAHRREELERLADELAHLLGASDAVPVGGARLPVHEVLLRLVERLEVPDELMRRVEAVKAQMAGGLAPEQVDTVLAEIAKLVGQMRSRALGEKRELEDFLKQLTQGLRELDRSLRQHLDLERQLLSDGRQLDAAMESQVRGIEVSVSQATDLSALQGAVRLHLNTIREHMAQFREAEERRQQQAETEVRKLTAQLSSMGQEIETLREQVHNERRQALVDPLTGIPNRLAYEERITLEYARWRRNQTPLCLAVWDVDNFKRINDRYGHQAGDKVLCAVAKLLKGQIRATDSVARYGGEEFVMLLPDTALEGAMLLAEKLRAALADCDFHHRNEPVPITISCGVAQFQQGDDPEAVFQRADRALYQAKAAGRNCCRAEAAGTSP